MEKVRLLICGNRSFNLFYLFILLNILKGKYKKIYIKVQLKQISQQVTLSPMHTLLKKPFNNSLSLVVRALERYSKDLGSSPGGDTCFSRQ